MSGWAVDSHVHLHQCYDEGLFFDSCFNNLRNLTSSLNKNGILFFTEGKNEDSFNYLINKSKIRSASNENVNYIINEIGDRKAIDVKWLEAGMRILIFPGFQIVTKEKLEVLSLGTNKRLSDGSLIEDTISDVISLGGIPVLPWAFGKWYGDRGRKIDELIRMKISNLFLGDNGGRSRLLPFPGHFKTAQMNGIKILPGSDPLPFSNEAKRPLSYGFFIETDINELNPLKSVKETLLNVNLKIKKFGRLTTPLSFIKTQVAMQIKKRKDK